MRPSGVPFVHALDTSGRRAVCIDLPSLAKADLGSARLRLTTGGALLEVETGDWPQARIDTHTFAVRAGTSRTGHVAGGAVGHRSGGTSGVPWEVVVVAIAALAAVVITARRRTRATINLS